MYGFIGVVNLKNDLLDKKDMNFNIIDSNLREQPMSFKYNEQVYTIVYNGNIYNANELRDELISLGFNFETDLDSELLLKSYIQFKEDIVHKINGTFSFAIWSSKERKLFIVRDHFGIKPLYYTIFNDNFIFSNEIKSILKYPGIESRLDKQGICELLGIGPAHTSGITAFKNIYELKPASYIVYNNDGVHINRYWKLKSKPHTDSLGKTCETVKYLLEDSIKKQLVTDSCLCTFLSGGLDSSIITLYASNYCKEKRSSSS